MSDQIVQIEEVANPRVNESNLDLTVVSESKEMHGSEELSLLGKNSERIKSKNNISLERSFEESNCELIDLINKNQQPSNQTLKEYSQQELPTKRDQSENIIQIQEVNVKFSNHISNQLANIEIVPNYKTTATKLVDI